MSLVLLFWYKNLARMCPVLYLLMLKMKSQDSNNNSVTYHTWVYECRQITPPPENYPSFGKKTTPPPIIIFP